MRTPLPIDPHLPQCLAQLQSHSALVVQASPGSGKTTRLPPALLNQSWAQGKAVWVLEPRRLAALFAARRVAEEMGQPVGETVGYHFRFERKEGPKTRLLFLTEGMFLRRLLENPELQGVAAVFIDEFHERHLSTDIALAYLKRLQTRREIKIVIASATLDTEPLQKYLGSALVDVVAPRFPVETFYLPSTEKPLERAVLDGVTLAAQKTRGNTLVFLPGMGEIRRAEQALGTLARNQGLEVFILHGDLTREDQDRALAGGGKPKIILSTNIAESSLTIEGVTAVVDSGLHRQASHSYWSGLPSLQTRATSRASAIQRAGRAGRTGPGVCVRLYSQGDFEGRPLQDTPEIRRADLAQSLLQMKEIGVADPSALAWLEAPNEGALAAATRLLALLGALVGDHSQSPLTPLGKELARLPLHPRLGRVLLEARELGVMDEAIKTVALISEGELDTLIATEPRRLGLSGAAERLSRQLRGALTPHASRASHPEVGLARSLLAGFPDRVAKKRASRQASGEIELTLCGEGNAFATNADALHHNELFVVIDADTSQHRGQTVSRARVRSLVPIEEEWLLELPEGLLSETDSTGWDETLKRIVTARELKYGKLVLERRVLEKAPHGGAPSHLEIWAREFFRIPISDLKIAPPETFFPAIARLDHGPAALALWERWIFLATQRPKLGFPEWNQLRDHWLSEVSAVSRELELRQLDWPGLALAQLDPAQQNALARLAPPTIAVGHRKVPIHYGAKPWIESRLQDFFGQKIGPALIDGTVPLTLHLLAPNQRALQVTSDLSGFWEREYPRIRKELGRKYPRQSWPENPVIAQPPQPKPRRR